MNTHAEYRRHSHQPPKRPPEGSQIGVPDGAMSPPAVHGDPSQRPAPPGIAPSGKRIAWIRPTELATYAAPLVGRGIDLQAELIRRARRSPVTAVRATGGVVRHSASRRSPVTSQREGLQL